MDEPDFDAEPRRPRRPRTAEDEAKAAARAERSEKRKVERDRVRAEASAAVDRARSKPAKPKRRARTARAELPPVPVSLQAPEAAIAKIVGKEHATPLVRGLEKASQAFAADRIPDARRHLAPLLKNCKEVPEVRELQGLIHYRLGQWPKAITQLEAFRELTGSTEQHPVLADAHRALGHFDDVEVLWAEIREASPSPALVTESRIVTAGALADQDRLEDAVRLLEKGWKPPKRPREDHLRRAYALADVYERSGRVARAREVFSWVQSHEPHFGDIAERVAALS